MRLFGIRLKILLRNKANVFWALLYPVLLAVFFQMGFGNLSSRISFETVDAYLASDKIEANLVSVMEETKYEDDKFLFSVNLEKTAEELETMLEAEEISGYIYYQEGMFYYHVRKNGLDETITKSFLDQYLQNREIFLEIQVFEPAKQAAVLADFAEANNYLEEIKTNNNPNTEPFIIYFYALIAMACMFGSFWGVGLVNDIQADNSTQAARISIAPTSKMKLIIVSFLAALTVQFTGNLLLILFLKYIIQIEFSRNVFLIILATFVGTISGISMGTFFAASIRGKAGAKEGILVAISLFLSALSGLMSVDIKYLVDKYTPFLKFINPASLITETFYSLYYFSKLNRYFLNLSILVVLSLIMIFSTFFKIRKVRYDSI